MECLPDWENKNAVEELTAKRDQVRKACIELAETIIGEQKVFPFPSVDPDAYSKLKIHEYESREMDNDNSATFIPIDQLIRQLAANGIKVAAANDLGDGNFYAVSAKNDSLVVVENGLSLWQLRAADGTEEDLKNLIIMSQELHDLNLAINNARSTFLKHEKPRC